MPCRCRFVYRSNEILRKYTLTLSPQSFTHTHSQPLEFIVSFLSTVYAFPLFTFFAASRVSLSAQTCTCFFPLVLRFHSIRFIIRRAFHMYWRHNCKIHTKISFTLPSTLLLMRPFPKHIRHTPHCASVRTDCVYMVFIQKAWHTAYVQCKIHAKQLMDECVFLCERPCSSRQKFSTRYLYSHISDDI